MSEMVARLDDLGRPAWIALMVVSFVLFWPVGLALLAFLIWSGRMGCRGYGRGGEDPRARFERKMMRMRERFDSWNRQAGPATQTGNRAFDEYRSETLRRLDEEAAEFRSFLDRLRHAKDKAEFDQFMDERRNRPAPDSTSGSVPTIGGGDQPPRI